MTAPAEPNASSVAAACLAQAERAESFTMEYWLALRPDGRIVKDAYAEAARLAWELDKRLGGPEADAAVASPPGTQPKDRERRPVLALTRELRECLGRLAKRSDLPHGCVGTLHEIAVLVAGEPGKGQGL